MNNIWLWGAVVLVGFFALLAVMSVTQIDRDAQRQKYEIECLKNDGKMEFIFGNGATCVHK
jgi:hypothetical protein